MDDFAQPLLEFIRTLVGDAFGGIGSHLVGSTNSVRLVFAGLALFSVAGVLWAALRAARPKS